MSRTQRLPRVPSPMRLRDALGAADATDARAARDLLSSSLRLKSYERASALRLVEAAGPDSGLAWEVRRLAVLLLEGLLLKLRDDEREEWAFVLARLGLLTQSGTRVKNSVLKEGYTTTTLPGFVRQLRQRLARLARAHELLAVNTTAAIDQTTTADAVTAIDPTTQTAAPALLDFVRLSRRECKLTLARYLLRPEEVAARVLGLVRTSRGVPDINPFQPPYVAAEAAHATARLPDYEAAVLRLLTADSRVYWVADATPSEINSLVEYPAGTVVLVLKPPGSSVEFEFKRAGRRGPRPLGVTYRRADGSFAPPSHRLDGGSTQEGLRYETHMASRFSRVFRLAHRRAAPIPDYLARVSARHVPAHGREADTLDYFTDPAAFGAGYDLMRAAMAEAVEAFRREGGANLPDMPGAVGLTLHFLTYVTPAQSVIAGTTSFRLDLLARYLSARGDESYFREGLKLDHSRADARRFADEILEEVLCVYRPPGVRFRSFAQYVAAAFRVAENRARADENYISAFEQIGTFWGTLLAIRGHSLGESFVARNVGLRSVWEGGRWRIKVVFMDHDNLQTDEVTPADFQAVGILKSLSADDVFIWGELESGEYANSESHCLEKIYRADTALAARGRAAFRAATLAAYRRTQGALDAEPGLRELFHSSFAARVRDWDKIIASRLTRRDAPDGLTAWRADSRAFLAARDYEADLIDALLLSVETYGDFLKKYSYLFEGTTEA